jgi:hypothetical protein
MPMSTSTRWLRVTLTPLSVSVGRAHWIVDVLPNSCLLRPPVMRVPFDHGALLVLRSLGEANSLRRTKLLQATEDERPMAGIENICEQRIRSAMFLMRSVDTHNVHQGVQVDEQADSRDCVGQEGDEEVEDTITHQQLPELRASGGHEQTDESQDQHNEIREHGYNRG